MLGDYAWTVEDDGIYEAIPMGIFEYPDGTGNKLRKGSVYSAGSVFDCGGERREFNKNVWLSQKMMGVLYDVGKSTINYHLHKLYEDGEIDENSVVRIFRTTADDGRLRSVIRKLLGKLFEPVTVICEFKRLSEYGAVRR